MLWDFILRLFIAGILGAVVGLDREYRAKEAGYRTHFLVSLGSALIMIVSQYGFQQIIQENSVSLDPSRVAAQVVSGIGFIGAGTIIIQKQFVRGLTTAAGIWATAGIGLAIGAGMNDKGYLLVSYQMEKVSHSDVDTFIVTLVIKAKKSTDDNQLLLFMEDFPEVTVERIE